MSDNNEKELIYISPFKYQVLQSFPFIAEDFDQITQYGLYCKLADKMNEVIANNNNLNDDMILYINKFNSLKSYVDNYFNNLDVDDQINDKLDEMAQSGVLQELLNNQYNELTASVNSQINSIESMVQSVASGSPLVASSTSEMSDTSRTYVNTTDGKWYYYDGDSWEIGGDYQATEIPNGAIDILKLDNKLQQNFITKYATEIDRGDAYTGFYNINGALSEDSNYKNYHIPLTLGKNYAIQYYNTSALAGLVIKDNSNNIIFKSSDTNIGSTYDFNCLYFKANQNNLTAYISMQKNVTYDPSFFTTILNRCYELDNISNALYYSDDVTLIKTIEGAYVSGTSTETWGQRIGTNPNVNINVYALEKGKSYKISAYNWSQASGITIVGFDNELIYKSSSANISNNHVQVTKEYTATKNGYILITQWITSNDYPSSILVTNKAIETPNKIANKKLGVDGDSIAHGNENSNVSFANLIAENNSMILQKLAYGGATITYGTQNEGVNRHWICTSVLNLDNDCDLVLVEGGFNDYGLNIPLGTITDSMTSSIDNTTFYGALETLARNLLSKFATSKVAFVTTHKINSAYRTANSIGKTYTDYINAIKEVMEKYSIPVIDLYNNSKFNTELTSYKSYTCNSDGVHPTTSGYNTFYNQLIVNSLNNLL